MTAVLSVSGLVGIWVSEQQTLPAGSTALLHRSGHEVSPLSQLTGPVCFLKDTLYLFNFPDLAFLVSA